MGILNSLARAAVGLVIETPVALVADIITLGGAIVDQHEPYTAKALKRVARNVANATEPNR